MGITKLADLIRTEAPDAVSHKDISDYTGKVVAFDASIVMNQFRTAVPSLALSTLTGVFFRTLTFLEHDIKPVFVFDGKPPVEKRAVLEKRAETTGWRSPTKHTGSASPQTTDCCHLLKLLGVPIIQAPGDGEAQCAQLARAGIVEAVASEDMDTLPFGGNILVRQLNAKKDSDITEYSLTKLLDILKITHEEFVDLCILLGCDYCDKIAGLGPKRALNLIQQHHTIENVVLHVNRKTHPIPHIWQYQDARKLFLNAVQTTTPDLVWTEPDEEALVMFLCHSKHIKEKRVRDRMERFHQARAQRRLQRAEDQANGHSRQTRMEDFFRVTRKRHQQMNSDSADSMHSQGKKAKTKQ